MAISSEIVSAASAKGLSVKEVPISVTYTKDGSTLNPVRHGVGVLNRILYMISERKPLLYFGIAGGISIGFGILAGIFVFIRYQDSAVIATGTAFISMILITIGILTVFTGLILNMISKRLNRS